MRTVNYEPLSPLHFLERSVYVFPEKIAVIYNDTEYTFSQFTEFPEFSIGRYAVNGYVRTIVWF